MRRPMIAGNWKMNLSASEAAALAAGLTERYPRGGAGFDLVVCPPYPYLAIVVGQTGTSGIGVGGQDCHAEPSGAHTGDVAAGMLADVGCSHVIVGHSERRQHHGETDGAVKAKAAAALKAGLMPIICIGETEAEKDAGRTEAVCAAQLSGSLPADASPHNTVIAYEPVWAIGTGRTPSVEDVSRVHAAIRAKLAELVPSGAEMRILYGGSVKPGNAAELLGPEDVDGALVGGASLKLDDFWGIATAV